MLGDIFQEVESITAGASIPLRQWSIPSPSYFIKKFRRSTKNFASDTFPCDFFKKNIFSSAKISDGLFPFFPIHIHFPPPFFHVLNFSFPLHKMTKSFLPPLKWQKKLFSPIKWLWWRFLLHSPMVWTVLDHNGDAFTLIRGLGSGWGETTRAERRNLRYGQE